MKGRLKSQVQSFIKGGTGLTGGGHDGSITLKERKIVAEMFEKRMKKVSVT
jgi:hypothetical protein